MVAWMVLKMVVTMDLMRVAWMVVKMEKM